MTILTTGRDYLFITTIRCDCRDEINTRVRSDETFFDVTEVCEKKKKTNSTLCHAYDTIYKHIHTRRLPCDIYSVRPVFGKFVRGSKTMRRTSTTGQNGLKTSSDGENVMSVTGVKRLATNKTDYAEMYASSVL